MDGMGMKFEESLEDKDANMVIVSIEHTDMQQMYLPSS